MNVTNTGRWATQAPYTSESLIEEFLVALNDEKIEIEKNSRDKKILITKGKKISCSEFRSIYNFLLNEDVRLNDDSPMDILIGDQKIPGHIISSDEMSVTISLERCLNLDIINEAYLIKSDTQLLKSLISIFEKVKKGEIIINHDGCLKVFGCTSTQAFSTEYSFNNISDYHPPPNEFQTTAINNALSQEVSFIWGPPGTGKTKTLGIILDQLIRSGQSVLLVSHTNLAVDEILLKYFEIESSKKLIQEGKVLRIGASGTENPKLKQINVDYVVEKLSADLRKDLNKYLTQKDALNKCVETLSSDVTRRIISDYEAIQQEIKSLSAAISPLTDGQEKKHSMLKKYKDDIISFEKQKKDLEGASFFRRLLSGTSIPKINNKISDRQQKIQILEGEINDLQLKLDPLNQKMNGHEVKKRFIRDKFQSIANSLEIPIPEGISTQFIREQLNLIQSKITSIDNRVHEIHKKIDEIKNNLIKNALVVGCTLTKAALDQNIYSNKYHALLLDEASMSPLPLVYFSAGLIHKKSNNYIISGDFRQLAPIAQSKNNYARKWLKRDIFEQSGIVNSVNNKTPDPRLTMLKVQHRMHPSIMSLINESMYNGELQSGEEVFEAKSKITAYPPYANFPLILIDTSIINPWIHKPRSGSRENLYSAMLAQKIAENILDEQKGGNVGIITPYNMQAKLINILLEEQGYTKIQATSATVHKFQGNQRHNVIIDLVDGPPNNKAGLPLTGDFINSDAGKLMNVAVSRAEGKLFVIANVDYFTNFNRSKLSEDHAVIKIIRMIQQIGLVIDSNTLIPSYSEIHTSGTTQFNETLENDTRRVILDESNFYPLFISDLKKAKKKVIIFSPFIGKERLSKMMDDLRHIKDKGIEIYIVTRSPKDQGSNKEMTQDLIDDMKKMGIHVLLPSKELNLHEKFHEKIALIDNTSFYFGSLNILSQSDSSETMLVYRSPESINFFIQSFDLERISRAGKSATISQKIKASQQTGGVFKLTKKVAGLSQANPGLGGNTPLENIERYLKNKYNLDSCPKCGGNLSLNNSTGELVIFCENFFKGECGGHCNVDDDVITDAISSISVVCNKCKIGKMRYRRGKFGPFIGCNQFPKCKYSVDIKKLS